MMVMSWLSWTLATTRRFVICDAIASGLLCSCGGRKLRPVLRHTRAHMGPQVILYRRRARWVANHCVCFHLRVSSSPCTVSPCTSPRGTNIPRHRCRLPLQGEDDFLTEYDRDLQDVLAGRSDTERPYTQGSAPVCAGAGSLPAYTHSLAYPCARVKVRL